MSEAIKEDDKFRLMFSKISAVKKSSDEVLKATGENYNIFRVLGLNSDELIFSKMISNLLNVKSKDGLSELRVDFLKDFVSRIDISNNDSNFDFSNAQIEIEKSIGKIIDNPEPTGGRFDILITIPIKNNNSYRIIIENKVYADDQDKQLLRYKNYAQKYYGNNYSIVYLTLDGKEPTEASTKIKEDELEKAIENNLVFWTCLSYKDDITEWLDYCAQKSLKYPYMRESINQFNSQIKRLTGGDFNKMTEKEIFKILSDNAEITNYLFKNENKYYLYVMDELISEFKNICKESNWNLDDSCIDKKKWGSTNGEGKFFIRKTPASKLKIGFGMWYKDLRQLTCSIIYDKGKENKALVEELREKTSLIKRDYPDNDTRICWKIYKDYSWTQNKDEILNILKDFVKAINNLELEYPNLF